MEIKIYPFTTKGDYEGEILPGICWYEDGEWVIEVGGYKRSYQYTQDREPLKEIESRPFTTDYEKAWELAEERVEQAYSKIS